MKFTFAQCSLVSIESASEVWLMGVGQQEFLSFAVGCGALQFGEFTLNSGRRSPYFFNSAAFSDGSTLSTLADFYARTIIDRVDAECMLFGPAYKGIPLVAATAVALDRNGVGCVPYAFNRKEVKDHGDEGLLVGAPLSGRVVIVEDVITSGLSIGNAKQLICAHGAHPVAAVISLDRSEFAVDSDLTATQHVQNQYGVEVHALATVYDLIQFVENDRNLECHTDRLRNYMNQYVA